MTSLQDIPQTKNKFQLKESKKTMKRKTNNSQTIIVKLLDLINEEIERNLMPTKSKIKKERLFDESNS